MPRVIVRGRGPHGQFEAEVEGTGEEVAHILREYATLIHARGSPGDLVDLPNAVSGAGHIFQLYQPVDMGPTGDLTSEEAAAMLVKLPSADEVERYIMEQPDRLHSIYDISARFLGKPIGFNPENAEARRLYHRMVERVLLARSRISRRDKTGVWTKARFRKHRSAVYRWKGSSPSGTVVA